MVETVFEFCRYLAPFPPPITLLRYTCLDTCKVLNCTCLVLLLALNLDENKYNVIHPSCDSCGPYLSNGHGTCVTSNSTRRTCSWRVFIRVQYQRINSKIEKSYGLKVTCWTQGVTLGFMSTDEKTKWCLM